MILEIFVVLVDDFKLTVLSEGEADKRMGPIGAKLARDPIFKVMPPFSE